MFRKLTLLMLFVFGTLCLVAGTIERGLAAVKCEDAEPNTGIYCPVQTGDDPSIRCTDDLPKLDCEGARTASSIETNSAITKYSPGNYAPFVAASYNPWVPAIVKCYTRTYCVWKDGKCQNGETEDVPQFWRYKDTCPK